MQFLVMSIGFGACSGRERPRLDGTDARAGEASMSRTSDRVLYGCCGERSG